MKRLLGERDTGTLANEHYQGPTPADTDISKNEKKDIDLNVAHGRYKQAEESLLKVIAAAPKNHAAKLRLIDIYYMTESITEFCTLADELQQEHRNEMSA